MPEVNLKFLCNSAGKLSHTLVWKKSVLTNSTVSKSKSEFLRHPSRSSVEATRIKKSPMLHGYTNIHSQIKESKNFSMATLQLAGVLWAALKKAFADEN